MGVLLLREYASGMFSEPLPSNGHMRVECCNFLMITSLSESDADYDYDGTTTGDKLNSC
jgi:hypothetical protein